MAHDAAPKEQVQNDVRQREELEQIRQNRVRDYFYPPQLQGVQAIRQKQTAPRKIEYHVYHRGEPAREDWRGEFYP